MTPDDLVWEDGAVRLADSSFPVAVTRSDALDLDSFTEEEMRIALAEIPDGRYVLCAWSKGKGQGPVLVLCEPVARIDMFHASQRLMTLEDGRQVSYGPSRKCGCGSRLKSYRPWSGRRVLGVRRPVAPWVAAS